MSNTHPPTDSVLRRHWEASQPASATASSAAATPPPSAQTGNASNSSAEGGFFGWLKRLFS